MAWFGFELDRETMTISLKEREDEPMHAPGPAKPAKVQRDPSKIALKDPVPSVSCDFMGEDRIGKVLPGPFVSWES